MAVYLIPESKSNSEQELMLDYGKIAGSTLKPFGANVMTPASSLEDDWSPDRLIVNELEATENLRPCCGSIGYYKVAPMRLKASESIVIILGK